MTTALAFALSWLLTPAWARLQRRLGLGKRVRPDGPASHLKKSGTPSMGGLAMAVAAALALALSGGGAGEVGWLALGFLLVGLADDLGGARGRPLRAREKLALQFLIAGLFALQVAPGLAEGWPSPWMAAAAVTLAVVAAANAMNFTDGVDGLAASVGAVMLAPVLNHPLAAAGLGALLGFLWHNLPPARVFMGDSGSEALGVLVAGLWITSGGLFLLPLAAAVPVAEVLSVVVQVAYFRATGGRRILKMAPLHHHLELSGWSEWEVTARFTLITALTTATAVGMWRGA